MQQPMAVAEVLVGQAYPFRSEQKRYVARRKSFSNETRAGTKKSERLLQDTIAHRSCSDNERAIRDSSGDGFVFFRILEQF